MIYYRYNFRHYITGISFLVVVLFLSSVTYGQNSVKSCPLDSCHFEGFENGGLIPDCWTQEYVNGTVDWQFTQGNPYPASPNSAFEGTYNAFFGCSSGCLNNETRLVAGPIHFNSLFSAVLSFRVHNPNNSSLKIYYKTSSTGTWTIIPTTIQTGNGTWMNYLFNLPNPGIDYYIAFDAKLLDSGGGICLDNVNWCQGCSVPTISSIIGNQTLCATPTYADGYWSVTPESGVIYEWQTSDNSVLTYGTTFSHSFMAVANYSLSVTPIGTCGPGNSKSINVCVNTGPIGYYPVNGESYPCPGTTETYYINGGSLGDNYWTVPPDWTIVNQFNDPINPWVTVNVGNSSGQIILVTFSTLCGGDMCLGMQSVKSVNPISAPSQPSVITGSANPCLGSNQVYSVTNVIGVTYTWSTPAGWSIVAGQNTYRVTVTVGANGGDITVSPSNVCSTGTSRTKAVTVSTAPLQPSAISGTAGPCQGSSQIYSVTNTNGITYTWSCPAGWTIISGQGTNSVTVTTGASSGNISVTPSNSCGTGTAQTLALVSDPLPAQPPAISGQTYPCAGTTLSYYFTGNAGENYTWTVPSGWSIVSGDGMDSVVVTSGSSGGTIEVVPSNICGSGTAQTLAVTTTDVPAQPSAISGQTDPCTGTTLSYHFNGNLGETYAWTVPSDWTIISGNGTDSIVVTAGSISGTIEVVPSNSCGNGIAQNIAVAPNNNVPAQPPAISGQTDPCTGTTLSYYFDGNAGENYAWTVPSGWSIISGDGTDSISVTAGSSGGNIQVVPSNLCGNGTLQTLSVAASEVPAQPAAISGQTDPCAGTTLSYYFNGNAGENYAWTVPYGWSIISGDGTDSISVTAGSSSGTIEIVPSNFCGSGTAQTLAVTTTDIPSQPPVISGQTDPCIGTTLSYYFTGNAGESYTWSVPSDWTIVSGDGTDSIVVTAGSISGTIEVVPSNICGNGTTQSIAVTPNNIPSQPPAISGQADPCSGSTLSYYFSGNAGENYAWSVPSGWSIVSGDGTDSVVVIAGNNSGTIEVVPSNICGSGTTSYVNITPILSLLPVVEITAQPSLGVCKGTPITLNANYSNGGTNPAFEWYLNGSFSGDTTFLELSNPNDGSEIFVTMNSNIICPEANPVSSDTVVISIHQDPPIPIVTVTGDSLFSSCSAGFSQWYFNGILIAGATSEEIELTGDGYYYTICSDGIGCSSVSDTILITFTGTRSGTLKIYPNPVNNTLMIENLSKRAEIIEFSIVTLSGKIIMNKKFQEVSLYKLDLSILKPGVYILEARFGDCSEYIRIIKE